MNFQKVFKWMPAPKQMDIAGKKYLFDPYRRKKVPATPEEFVRQKVLWYFRWVLRVPPDCIQVEVHMSRYGYTGNNDRADFLVLRPDRRTVLAVVECKALHVPISEEVKEQVLRYARYLNTEYAFAVNGLVLESYAFQPNHSYQIIERPRNYRVMCLSHNNPAPQVKTMERRSSLAQLQDPAYVRQNYDEYIGRNTSCTLLPLAANLCDCLRDTRAKLPPAAHSGFTLTADLGVRTKKIVTPGGGYFQNNNYRMFAITDQNENAFQVGLCVSLYGNEKTMLAVYVENETASHHALQLELDKNVSCEGDPPDTRFVLTHTGRINIGRKGPAKISEVLQYVQDQCPALLRADGKILLGVFHSTEWITLTSPSFQYLLERLINYALILDRFRNVKKLNPDTMK